VLRYPASGQPRARLVCFPHAGAGASTFSGWDALLPDSVELVAVQLPGRETRIREPAPDDLVALLEDLAVALDFGDRVPSTLFGHSWGGILAFELSRRFNATGTPPAGLIVSGTRAPHFISPLPVLSHLPRDELLAGLGRLNGIHPEILAHDDYLDVVIPTFRSDLRMVERYRLVPGAALPCPITVFGGEEDPMTSPATLDEWRRYTTAEFRRQMFPGDHFFFVSERVRVVAAVAAMLAPSEVPVD